MKSKTNLIIMSMILGIFSMSFILASGVSSPYWNGNPLRMIPGETKIVQLTLQNMVGDENLSMSAQIKKGNDIASIEKTEYFVPLGTKDTLVALKIKIPDDAEANTTHRVSLSFRTIVSSSGEGVSLKTGMDTGFDVIVVEGESKISTSWLMGIIIAIIILIIIIIIVKNKKKRR